MKSSFTQESQIHHVFDAAMFDEKYRNFKLGRDFAMDEAADVARMFGIGQTRFAEQQASMGVAMDTIQNPILPSSIATPVQFLQNWLPGIVEVVTAKRKTDEIVGMSTIGSWADEQIVQQVTELSGAAVPYGDTNVIPYANWNPSFNTRTVVRFEQGIRVGLLEEARSAAIRVNSAETKRKSAAQQLEITRNAIGFYGYNSGNGLTYGLLNDPALPAYVNVANPGSGTTWQVKTFLQIQADILTAIQALRTQSQEQVDPGTTPLVLTVATSARDYMAKTSDFGISVMTWLNSTYPNVRVVSAPQFNAANGGANVFYLHADSVDDGSTDDNKTFIQVIPAKFQLLGMAKSAKFYEEDYSNATAGIMCKRPWAVVRYSGV